MTRLNPDESAEKIPVQIEEAETSVTLEAALEDIMDQTDSLRAENKAAQKLLESPHITKEERAGFERELEGIKTHIDLLESALREGFDKIGKN
jgi:hypothetical protein